MIAPGVLLFSRLESDVGTPVILPQENKRKRSTQAITILCKIFILTVTGEPPPVRYLRKK
jgi:hypothetical protein